MKGYQLVLYVHSGAHLGSGSDQDPDTTIPHLCEKLIFLLILFAFVLQGNAIEPDFFGYFEPQLMTFYENNYDKWSNLNSNKLRLDIEAKPSSKVKFGANVNFFNYNGKTAYNLLDYLPPLVAATIQPDTEPYYEIAYEDSIGLDNVSGRKELPTHRLV